MNTITITLTENGRIADLQKDFPLYQGQFNNVLLQVKVPTSILAPNYHIQHYCGRYTGPSSTYPTDVQLTAFATQQLGSGHPLQGDVVDFIYESGNVVNYRRYVYGTSTWAYNDVEYFNITDVAGTTLNCSVVATQRNGALVQGKYYSMRYVKNITTNNIEYALYSRLLPREFVYYEGQGSNAPIWVFNVQNIDLEENSTIIIITSQIAQIDVMPSTELDNDEPIEASWKQEIDASVNALLIAVGLKQDKIDQALATTSKSVVGGINELNTKSNQHTEDISNLDTRVTTNATEIANIKTQIGTGEEYVGKMTVTTLPTNAELDAFVVSHTSPSRQPKGGDVVIVVQEITGATDKIFKYIRNSTSWNSYEIPPIESAGNGSLGIVKGTYGIGSANTTQASIVGGEIQNIYFTVNGNLVDANTQVSSNKANIDGFLDGSVAVEKSNKATKDGDGNIITATYMTNEVGATKTYVKDYALSKDFNITHYLNNDGTQWVSQTPTTTYTIEKTTSSGVGYKTLISANYTLGDEEMQLSAKNSFITKLRISALNNVTTQFLLSTYIKKTTDTEYTQIGAELSEYKELVAGNVYNYSFSGDFDVSPLAVYDLKQGDIIKQEIQIMQSTSQGNTYTIYGESTRFYLNTATYKIVVSSGNLGEQQAFNITEYALGGNYIMLKIPTTTILNDNTECYFNIASNIVQIINANPTFLIFISRNFTEQIGLYGYSQNGQNVLANELKKFTISNGSCIFKAFYTSNNIAFRIEGFNESDLVRATKINQLMNGDTGIIVDLNEAQTKVDVHLDLTGSTNGSVLRATSDDVAWDSVDSAVTTNSTHLITSGAVASKVANMVTTDTTQDISGVKSFSAGTTAFAKSGGAEIDIMDGNDLASSNSLLRLKSNNGCNITMANISSSAPNPTISILKQDSIYQLQLPYKNGTIATTSDIPSPQVVNDGILTIQKNGTDIATFTANDADNVTANIEIPTKTSDITNDGDGTSQFATQSYVNTYGGKIDKIKKNGTELSIVDKAVDIPIPTKTSDITNDSGFITSSAIANKLDKSGGVMTGAIVVGSGNNKGITLPDQSNGTGMGTNYGTNYCTLMGFVGSPSKFSIGHSNWQTNIRGSATRPTYNGNNLALYSDLPTIPTNVSAFTNDSGYITNSADNLTNYTKTSELSPVATSGSYNDLSNTPTIPSVSTTGVTDGTNTYNANDKLGKTENTNVSVLGVTKNTTSLGSNQLVAPNGIIFAGSAANAGLVTRGICGVTEPSATGSCTKENLYINYDGNNNFNASRQIVLNAGVIGTHYGNNLYQYCVPRGDIVKNWVESKGYSTFSGSYNDLTNKPTLLAFASDSDYTNYMEN